MVGGALSAFRGPGSTALITMATTISKTDGNLLRGDIEGRDEIRAAAHVLASLLSRGEDAGGTYVLDFEKEEDTGSLDQLGLYDYEDYADIQEGDEEPYEDDAEGD